MLMEPKVSILIITYNHENYISEAIESVISQNCKFPIEIIISDDCSTDRTFSIIKEYEKKYDGLISVLDNDCNVGITKNYKRGFEACTGKYVAVLEGDDYWTSPEKLSIMINFLDNNTGCAMAFNRFIISELKSKRFNVQPWPIVDKFQLISVTDLVKDNFIGNFSTCVYRNDVIKKIDPALYEVKVYDWMFNIMMAQHGMIGYIPEVLSVYRLHSSGTWTQKTEVEKIKETIQSIDEYNQYLNFIYDPEFTEHKNRLLSRLEPLLNPNLLTRKQKIKKLLKQYIPPVLVGILKAVLPPKLFGPK